VTVEEYGKSPGCSRCNLGVGPHTSECRDRILAHLQRDEQGRASASAPVPAAAAADVNMEAAAAAPATPVVDVADDWAAYAARLQSRGRALGFGPAEPEDAEMSASGPEPPEKKTRTVGSLELEAFVECGIMYEGLDNQDHRGLGFHRRSCGKPSGSGCGSTKPCRRERGVRRPLR
jgi:hypothetical protein